VHEDNLPALLAADLNSSFERLAREYQQRIYAFALRLSGRREDAEEIAQDTLVRAYRALAAYPPERVRLLALRPWLFQIALNVARNRARIRTLPSQSLDGGSEDTVMEFRGDEDEQPERLVERAERTRELAALLMALPERFRAAVVLRHVEGLGYAEVASVLGQPIGTVKANVHRGVRLLREALIQQMSAVR
jgi:RNA polymerase sigma-70 factor, ECF subfamily